MKYVSPLSDAEIETLQQMHAYPPSRRARMRAHSLLLSHQPTPSRILPASIRSTLGVCRPGLIAGRLGGSSVYMIVPVVDVLRSSLLKSSKQCMRISTTLPEMSRKSSRRWSKRRVNALVPKPSNVPSKKPYLETDQAVPSTISRTAPVQP